MVIVRVVVELVRWRVEEAEVCPGETSFVEEELGVLFEIGVAGVAFFNLLSAGAALRERDASEVIEDPRASRQTPTVSSDTLPNTSRWNSGFVLKNASCIRPDTKSRGDSQGPPGRVRYRGVTCNNIT